MASFMANQLGMRMLAPARRITKVAPVKGRRACALVFDESPCAAEGVTEAILAALRTTGAKATFAVYGSTAENYPDRRGKAGREAWERSGIIPRRKQSERTCFPNGVSPTSVS